MIKTPVSSLGVSIDRRSKKPFRNIRRGLIVKTEDNNTWTAPSPSREEITEIQIKGYDDSALFDGFEENRLIREPMQILLSKMDRIVARLP
jgi:hypothetical protein